MSRATELEFREAFGMPIRDGYMDCQNDDRCDDWKSHNPQSAWTLEDQVKWEEEQELLRQAELANGLAMAYWWDLEGVRCATFGRDPNQNPYLDRSS